MDWEQLLADLRGDDVDRALLASEQITANITSADLPRIYALARDDDYFVRVMAGDILAKTAGITALPLLLQIMLRNEAEGFDNDGLDAVTKALIDANPITARAILEPLSHGGDERAQTLAHWGLAGVPEETTVVTALVAPLRTKAARRGCLMPVTVMALLVVALWTWGNMLPAAAADQD